MNEENIEKRYGGQKNDLEEKESGFSRKYQILNRKIYLDKLIWKDEYMVYIIDNSIEKCA